MASLQLHTVAIGNGYEREADRLCACFDVPVSVFTSRHPRYVRRYANKLVNGLYHKANFANYIAEDDGTPVVFLDADAFSFVRNPLETFTVQEDTDIAFVPYRGKWHFPDVIRQRAFDHFGYKVNSGFLYFRTLLIAQRVCTLWAAEYEKRVLLYDDPAVPVTEAEYDEYALMLALMTQDLRIEQLPETWNYWVTDDFDEMRASGNLIFQSHRFEVTSEIT